MNVPGGSSEFRRHLMPCFEAPSGLQIHDAHGMYLETNVGRLLDAESGYWNVGLGHGWLRQGGESSPNYFADVSLVSHPAAEALANRLCMFTESEQVIFLTSGSSAIDCAIRIAFQATTSRRGHRSSVLSIKGAYHGSTALSLLAAGGSYGRWLPTGSLSVTSLGSWAFDPNLTEKDFEQLLDAENVDWPNIACFIFEPIQGAGGVRELNAKAYDAIAKRCLQAGALIVADEVATGIGRAGHLIRTERLAYRPDIVVLGKGLTNGSYPLSAVLLKPSIVDAIQGSTKHTALKYLWGETFGGAPEGCSAALRVLEAIREPGFLPSVRTNSLLMSSILIEALANAPLIEEVRCPDDAMMFGVKLTSKFAADAVRILMIGRGVRVINEGSSVILMPMLLMPNPQLREIASCLRGAIDDAAAPGRT